MNNDLISRKALWEALQDVLSYPFCSLLIAAKIQKIIERAPTVDPHKHGRWIMRGGKLHCSNCDSLAPLKRGWEDGCTTYEYTASRWCPDCGAQIDLED